MSVASLPSQGVDEYIHGVLVRDPYRWLEDRQLPETEAWIHEQQQRCNEYFAECEDLTAFRETVASYLDVETVDQPVRVGDRYFFRRRDKGREQGCIYVRELSTGDEKLLVDPSSEGPYVSVCIHRVSTDGNLLAYEVRHGGEDQAELRIFEVAHARTLLDRVERGIQRGFAFTPSCDGYIYSTTKPNDKGDHFIHLHPFGSETEDEVLLRVPSSPRSRLVLRSDSTRIGAIHSYEYDGELVADVWTATYENLSAWHPIVRHKPLPYAVWPQGGRLLLFLRAQGANGRVVEIDRDGNETCVVVPERGETIHQLAVCGSFVCVLYRIQSGFHLCTWELTESTSRDIALPSGTVKILPHLGEGTSCFLSCESFTKSITIFECAMEAGTLEVWFEATVRKQTDDLDVRELEYPSSDGTMIPLTLVGTVDATGRGPCPVVMTSYGGFGAISTPQFSILVSVLIGLGFVFALPHVRGGGELGPTWHEAGRRRNKATSFTDFIAAATWLIEERIATPGQLAVFGGSNSGLLVGAVLTLAPTLFRAALCIAPLLDMVRYERFGQAARWQPEYGTVENAEEFRVLLNYSPYHAIQTDIDYPAVLFVAGDKDERCDPAHVRKTAARLLGREAQSHPVLVDYDVERGHTPVMPLHVRIDALVRRIAFVVRELGLSAGVGGQLDSTNL